MKLAFHWTESEIMCTKFDDYFDFNFADYTGRGVRVAIVDSGIDPSHPEVKEICGGIAIKTDELGNLQFSDDYLDSVGHGTACAGIIKKKAPEVSLFSIKIFEENLATNAKVLIEAIKWAVDNKINIVNLSLGTTDTKLLSDLQIVCDYAHKNNTILVAAEHNESIESYPAYFSNVIGVTGGKVYDKYSYYYRDGHPVEFVARGDRQKLAWLQPRYVFMGGTSFAAPHITGIIALILEKYPEANFDEIRNILAHKASSGQIMMVHEVPDYLKKVNHDTELVQEKESKEKFSWIRKAAIYPYNKETHAFIRFRDLLHFKIVGVVDPIGKGLVGKDAGEVIGIDSVGITITHKLEQALSKADTLIIGYVDQLSRISKKDILKDTVEKTLKLGKNVFSFSDINRRRYPDLYQLAHEKQLQIYCPVVAARDFKRTLTAKNPAMEVDKPVVGIFGTSSQQGKFTTQLALRKKLMEEGYKVGQIGTEHHSELFGFDLAFPIGYSASVKLPLESYIPYLNLKMAELCKCKNPDIVIVGAQSGIIPFGLSENSKAYTLPSIAFLFGTKPDAYILAVNSIDPDDYIQDSIKALEALGKGKTILLTMSDKEKDIRAGFGTSRVVNRQLSQKEIEEKLSHLEKTFNLPATEIITEKGQNKLLNVVIDYFAED